jgi:UTP:GlnB (protein PII) uridylyltransferase
MAINIDIGYGYNIQSDVHQYILSKGKNQIAFFPTIESLLMYFIDMQLRIGKKIETIKELIAYQEEIRNEINDKLKPLSLKIVREK